MSYSMYIRLIGFFILLSIVLIRADIAKLMDNNGYHIGYILPPTEEK